MPSLRNRRGLARAAITFVLEVDVAEAPLKDANGSALSGLT
jgi:hypothetical protein